MKTVLVAYSEIALKSRYVRSQLERNLVEDIKTILTRNGYDDFQVLRRFGRIYVDNAKEGMAELISKIFGVANTMPAQKTTSEINNITELTVNVALDQLKQGQSFAIRSKVIGEHTFGSQDLAVKTGSAVMEGLKDRNISVNLTKPNLTIYIEVRDKDAFIYNKILKGVGGLPYGTQGKLVSLFSGGIDSPVATWMIMKRGGAVLPLLMDQRPYVGDNYITRAKDAIKQIRKYIPRKKYSLYIAPIGKIMETISQSPEPRYNCILCKRAMYRIAVDFAKKKGARGIITGESLGQVASQTLENLYVLDEAVDFPIIRSTIGLDKVEIENIAKEIDTYNISAVSIDGCTVVPSGPTTRAKLDKVFELENELNLVELCSFASSKIDSIEVI